MRSPFLYVIVLLTLVIPCRRAFAQCDSNYVKLFSKSTFEVNAYPCDSFVVMAPGYYDRISLKYNLSQKLIRGQASEIDNLLEQRQQYKAQVDTLKSIIRLTDQSRKDYQNLYDQSQKALNESIGLTKSLSDSAATWLKVLSKEHKRELRKSKLKAYLLGGAVGALIGVVVTTLLLPRL